MSQVEIKVHGREYRVTCEKGQEDRLQKSAAFLDKRVSAMSADLPDISETRLMLLAALTICDELFEARERALDLEDAGVALDSDTLGGASRAIEAAAKRVSDITAKLDG
ncbi:cell division protein ZapA [Hyphococcus sp.]|uniref:cell division protein ZapA n=1 Tax=Hyphococcus sp. TaxID=2038636 RepID=UPI0035C70D74